ncbi:MAG: choice-of-anchor L domain-containing protein, partial [Kofleriaceae bacterium]|nr:choice-of-anchor L domain-containing protein [Kofleriaceae bacterium]
EDQGDCNDNPDDGGSLIGPGAIEVAVNAEGEPELIDNDCDGIVDEGIEPCPTDLLVGDGFAFAAAIEVCHQTIQANFSANMDTRGQNILPGYGNVYVPFVGPTLAVLSNGIAIDANDPAFVFQSADFSVSNPDPDSAVTGNVQDLSSITLSLQVPSNANSFSFDFNFMSIEFPEYVGDVFDDTFLALLESEAFTGNVSFDSLGNQMSINAGFMDVCAIGLAASCTGEDDLIGTGFEVTPETPTVAEIDGGGTGWLTTTAPVIPGEKIKITFLIYDDGTDIFGIPDHVLNSTVLIDNFRWGIEEVDGPVTVD